MELLPLPRDPGGDGDKVSDEGWDGALEQGVVAQDDVGVEGLGEVVLGDDCGRSEEGNKVKAWRFNSTVDKPKPRRLPSLPSSESRE